jgi:hypothetical protein
MRRPAARRGQCAAPHPLVSSTMDLLKVGWSATDSPMQLRELAEWTVRPRLLAAMGWRAPTSWRR